MALTSKLDWIRRCYCYCGRRVKRRTSRRAGTGMLTGLSGESLDRGGGSERLGALGRRKVRYNPPNTTRNRAVERSPKVLTKAPMDKIESLNEWLGENELRGLWQGKAALYREPDPFGPARLWKWDTIQAGLEAATELVPTDYRDTRRAIHLSHPSLSGGATNTLAMAVQLVKAGESVFAHRHTLAAMRFVIQGSPDVCTITDGEKCSMERGDLLVQRNWGWHNHINDSPEHAMWIDCLDTGLMSMLRTEFFESHSEEKFQMQHSQTDSAIRTPGALSPPGQQPQKLSYKWSETLPALLDMLPEHKSPFDAPGAWSTAIRPRAGRPSQLSPAGSRCWSPARRRRPTGIRPTMSATRSRVRGCRRLRARRWRGRKVTSSWCPTGLGTATGTRPTRSGPSSSRALTGR